jgi:hypothetical protein
VTASDLTIIAPFVAAILLAAAILVMDFIAPDRTVPALFVTFIGLTIIGALIVITGQHPGSAFRGGYVVDELTTFLDLLFLSIVALTMLFAPDYLEGRGLWDDAKEEAAAARWNDVIGAAIKEAEAMPAPSASSMFDGVYHDLPWNLREQRDWLASEGDDHAKGEGRFPL